MGASPQVDHETFSAARAFIRALAGCFDVSDVRLFGSRARGTHASDSDVDVAVVLRGPCGDVLATKLAMADIAFDAMLKTGLLVDPLPISMDEWARPESHGNPRLLENIAREGVRL